MKKKETYLISGMSCAACSSAVERVTRKIDGVEQSDVNLTTKKMTITYDTDKVTPQLIISKVQKAGFGCELFNKDKSENDNPDQGKTGKKLIITWLFTILLMYISMGQMLPVPLPLPAIFDMHNSPSNFALIQLILTIPVLFLCRHIFINGFSALFHKNPNMNTLVAIGSSCSFLYSLYITFFIFQNPALVHNLYYEAATMVLTFVMTGKYLESRSTKKTKGAITALMKLAPETALLVDGQQQKEVFVKDLKPGDIILVKPGTRIPVDGIVTEGSSSVDESMLTGESLPIEKYKDSSVTGGSMNINGAIYVTVTRTGKDTTLSKIIEFMEDAQSKKAPIAKYADKISAFFVPVVIGIAIVAGIIWFILGQDFSFILRIITSILVIACPCALGLATPTAIMVGTGLGASHGILIRSGEALETAGQTEVVVMDKTGTVTKGKPSVTEVIPSDKISKEDLLIYASVAESVSEHPISKAITQSIAKEDSKQFKVVNFQNIPGKGIIAEISKEEKSILIAIGNRFLMQENNIAISENMEEKSTQLANQGCTVVFTAQLTEDVSLLGLIAVSDIIREDSKEAIKTLKSMGIKTHLLTGDNIRSASFIGKEIGIDEITAEVFPDEKAAVIQQLQHAGTKVMMVGDGINDAPALAQADTGVAIGGGSDIAIEAGSIILMKNNLTDVARAISLSRLTIRKIKQNLFWAFLYNTIGIPIAAGIIYPFTGILLTPMLASFAMSLSSICVVTNSLRLRNKKL